MHISSVSGHRQASLAIEKALQELDGNIQVKSIDAFRYTNPFWERFIGRLYIIVIKAIPGLWGYLYDNSDVLKKVEKTRSLVHKLNAKKIKKLFDEFCPDIIVCTQAFPCGMVADYKRRCGLNIPLIGVLTDYAPHSYWLDDFVDTYIVPAPEIEQGLIQKGIAQERLQAFGIPIDSKFKKPVSRDEIYRRLGLNSKLPIILIMGGGQGLGPIRQIVRRLDKLTRPVQLIVVCGTNKRLYKWLAKRKSLFNNQVLVMGYTENIDELMEVSTFIITKPGGLTSTEALSKSLPILIVHPLPGQEKLNTDFLLKNGVALKVESVGQLHCLVEDLLSDNARLENLSKRASAFARPDSALQSAQLILNMTEKNKIKRDAVSFV